VRLFLVAITLFVLRSHFIQNTAFNGRLSSSPPNFFHAPIHCHSDGLLQYIYSPTKEHVVRHVSPPSSSTSSEAQKRSPYRLSCQVPKYAYKGAQAPSDSSLAVHLFCTPHKKLCTQECLHQHSSREVILHLRLEENMRDMLPGNPPRAEIRLPVQRVSLQTATIIAFSDGSLVFAS